MSMGTAIDTTATISRIAYADALRDDSPAAEARRQRALDARQPFCELCGRALKPGATCSAAYAYGDGRLAATLGGIEDIDHVNVSEILIGNDCAVEVPERYRLDWTIEDAPVREADLRQLLSIAADVNEANLREIVEGAVATAREHAESDIVMDPTGAMITDTVGRIWVEMRVAEGADTWVGGWYSNDGHVAMSADEVFAGEAAWTL